MYISYTLDIEEQQPLYIFGSRQFITYADQISGRIILNISCRHGEVLSLQDARYGIHGYHRSQVGFRQSGVARRIYLRKSAVKLALLTCDLSLSLLQLSV